MCWHCSLRVAGGTPSAGCERVPKLRLHAQHAGFRELHAARAARQGAERLLSVGRVGRGWRKLRRQRLRIRQSRSRLLTRRPHAQTAGKDRLIVARYAFCAHECAVGGCDEREAPPNAQSAGPFAYAPLLILSFGPREAKPTWDRTGGHLSRGPAAPMRGLSIFEAQSSQDNGPVICLRMNGLIGIMRPKDRGRARARTYVPAHAGWVTWPVSWASFECTGSQE
jgi:hypothetical protein